MTETHHESLYAGESRTLNVTVATEGDGRLDLTDGSATWILQDSDGADVLTKTDGGDITLTNPSEGELTVAIAAADTSGREGKFRHFLRVEDGSDNVAVPLEGRFVIRASPF